ncbi:thiamine pyrophosphate-binding protein [Streptomyces chartreusis]|nr:thiamine pyrophosphate-binding protein [Streptomyces chartreusis]
MGSRPALALLDILRGEGVDRVFGNPGTTELPFLAALSEIEDAPEYVLGVHEGAVVSMADGYTRGTGRPAFVSLHIAAGLANGLIGLLNARRSRTPLVVTAGQQDRRHLQQEPMLAGDLTGLAAPAVKAAYDIRHAHDLPLALRRAFALAVRPPAGPVFLSLPMDMLAEDTEIEVPARTPAPAQGPAPGLERAALLLGDAARPAIVAGDGVGREDALGALVRTAEACGATVHHQPMSDGLNFPTTHPLYAGMLPPRHDAIRSALAAYDTVLIVGAHAFTPHHYTPGPALPPGLTVVQLDSDPDEIGRNFPADAGLVGVLGPSLHRLATLLADRVPEHTAKGRVQRAGERHAVERDRAAYSPAPLAPWAAAHAVAAGLPPDAVVVEEAITVGLLLLRAQHDPGDQDHWHGQPGRHALAHEQRPDDQAHRVAAAHRQVDLAHGEREYHPARHQRDVDRAVRGGQQVVRVEEVRVRNPDPGHQQCRHQQYAELVPHHQAPPGPPFPAVPFTGARGVRGVVHGTLGIGHRARLPYVRPAPGRRRRWR